MGGGGGGAGPRIMFLMHLNKIHSVLRINHQRRTAYPGHKILCYSKLPTKEVIKFERLQCNNIKKEPFDVLARRYGISSSK